MRHMEWSAWSKEGGGGGGGGAGCSEGDTFRVHGEDDNTSKGLPSLNLAGHLQCQLHRNQMVGIPCKVSNVLLQVCLPSLKEPSL